MVADKETMRITANDSLISCWRVGQTTLLNSVLLSWIICAGLNPDAEPEASPSAVFLAVSFFLTIIYDYWCLIAAEFGNKLYKLQF